MVRGLLGTARWDDPVWSARHLVVVGVAGTVAFLLVWLAVGAGPGPGAARAGGSGSGGSDVVPGPAGRHFVVVTGGGDTAYLAIGTTSMSVAPGTMVAFDPLRVRTSLDGCAPGGTSWPGSGAARWGTPGSSRAAGPRGGRSWRVARPTWSRARSR